MDYRIWNIINVKAGTTGADDPPGENHRPLLPEPVYPPPPMLILPLLFTWLLALLSGCEGGMGYQGDEVLNNGLDAEVGAAWEEYKANPQNGAEIIGRLKQFAERPSAALLLPEVYYKIGYIYTAMRPPKEKEGNEYYQRALIEAQRLGQDSSIYSALAMISLSITIDQLYGQNQQKLDTAFIYLKRAENTLLARQAKDTSDAYAGRYLPYAYLELSRNSLLRQSYMEAFDYSSLGLRNMRQYPNEFGGYSLGFMVSKGQAIMQLDKKHLLASHFRAEDSLFTALPGNSQAASQYLNALVNRSWYYQNHGAPLDQDKALSLLEKAEVLGGKQQVEARRLLDVYLRLATLYRTRGMPQKAQRIDAKLKALALDNAAQRKALIKGLSQELGVTAEYAILYANAGGPQENSNGILNILEKAEGKQFNDRIAHNATMALAKPPATGPSTEKEGTEAVAGNTRYGIGRAYWWALAVGFLALLVMVTIYLVKGNPYS